MAHPDSGRLPALRKRWAHSRRRLISNDKINTHKGTSEQFVKRLCGPLRRLLVSLATHVQYRNQPTGPPTDRPTRVEGASPAIPPAGRRRRTAAPSIHRKRDNGRAGSPGSAATFRSEQPGTRRGSQPRREPARPAGSGGLPPTRKVERTPSTTGRGRARLRCGRGGGRGA